jgi:serine/threonine-protein kinase
VLPEATETPFFEASPTATNEPPTVTPIATETPLAQITPQAGDERIADEDDMVQLFVPAGEYLMGASANDPSASPEEMPAHFVTLDPFWIDKFEVTNAQYVAFLNEKGNSLDCFGENCMAVQPDEPNAPIFLIMNGFAVEDELAFHPATYVSWYGAAAYCQSVGRRLPTEAEWEFAARGTDGRIYPWGNLFEKSALNYCDQSCDSAYNDASFNDGFAETAPVGTYPTGVSPFGAMDMGGNVWEWAADWYGADFYNVSRVSNPLGPDSGEHKVLRGGAFGFVREGNWRTTDRGLSAPDFIAPDIGFRCVADE